MCAQALQVLDNSGIPAFIYDTGADSPQSDRRLSGKTGSEFKLLAANHCMAALTGYQREELLGMSVMSLLVAPGARRRAPPARNLPRQGGFTSSGGGAIAHDR